MLKNLFARKPIVLRKQEEMKLKAYIVLTQNNNKHVYEKVFFVLRHRRQWTTATEEENEDQKIQ